MSTELMAPVQHHAVSPPPADVPLRGTRRPERALMYYYLLRALMTGPGFIVMAPYFWFRYRTLHYEFDDEGVTVRWGILFRREVSLTFARIQDIHLASNVVERWLRLGRIDIQTASGQAGAEATIEGLHDFEQVRDALYVRMRGSRGTTPSVHRGSGDAEMSEVAAALRETAAELRALRAAFERRER